MILGIYKPWRNGPAFHNVNKQRSVSFGVHGREATALVDPVVDCKWLLALKIWFLLLILQFGFFVFGGLSLFACTFNPLLILAIAGNRVRTTSSSCVPSIFVRKDKHFVSLSQQIHTFFKDTISLFKIFCGCSFLQFNEYCPQSSTKIVPHKWLY